jgi:hypothetical protein
MSEQFAAAARLVRFYHPDNARLLANELGARDIELYPLFVGADVDFIIGGEVARMPDFRPRLKEITVPIMVLAGRYDRALYPQMQRQFTEYAPQIRLEFLERSGSFSHVEEPHAVFTLLGTLSRPVSTRESLSLFGEGPWDSPAAGHPGEPVVGVDAKLHPRIRPAHSLGKNLGRWTGGRGRAPSRPSSGACTSRVVHRSKPIRRRYAGRHAERRAEAAAPTFSDNHGGRSGGIAGGSHGTSVCRPGD